MPIVDERIVLHIPKGDLVVSNRVRYYPYKITFIDLNDFMRLPNTASMPVYTEIVRAKNSEEAKTIIRTKASCSIAIASAGRYPKRLGKSRGVQYTTLTERQIKAILKEVHSGVTKVPHAINPSAFVTNNPNSTIYTRQTPSPRAMKAAAVAAGIGAPRTALKSTPIPLSSSVIDVGGFVVGYKKPGSEPEPVPTVSQQSPQIDISDLKSMVVNTGAVLPNIGADAEVSLPSGSFDYSTSPALEAAEEASSTSQSKLFIVPTTNSKRHIKPLRWIMLGLGALGIIYYLIR